MRASLPHFSLVRLFIASLVLIAATFLLVGAIAKLPVFAISVLTVVSVALFSMWILLPQIRLHGLRGVSALKFSAVAASLIAASVIISATLLYLVFALWPFLDLPPLPSD